MSGNDQKKRSGGALDSIKELKGQFEKAFWLSKPVIVPVFFVAKKQKQDYESQNSYDNYEAGHFFFFLRLNPASDKAIATACDLSVTILPEPE